MFLSLVFSSFLKSSTPVSDLHDMEIFSFINVYFNWYHGDVFICLLYSYTADSRSGSVICTSSVVSL